MLYLFKNTLGGAADKAAGGNAPHPVGSLLRSEPKSIRSFKHA